MGNKVGKTVFPFFRFDSNNSGQFEKELFDALDENREKELDSFLRKTKVKDMYMEYQSMNSPISQRECNRIIYVIVVDHLN